MNDNRPIGIFDSGVGGLSILLELQKLLPEENFVYLADQNNAPFGSKNKKELEIISERALNFLLSQKVKAVIVGCNTATVYSLDYLRSKFNLPIIGTVPVVKTIVKETKTGKVAIFSTPATAESSYLKSLIKKYSNDTKVFRIGGSGLEELIEKGEVKGSNIDKKLNQFLLPLIKKNVDAIALGCTHYPFIKGEIEKLFGDKIQVFDSGGAIARRTKQILKDENLLNKERAEDMFFTTGDVSKFKKIAEKLLKKRLLEVKRAIID